MLLWSLYLAIQHASLLIPHRRCCGEVFVGERWYEHMTQIDHPCEDAPERRSPYKAVGSKCQLGCGLMVKAAYERHLGLKHK